MRGVDGEDTGHVGGWRGADTGDAGMRVIAASERNVQRAPDDAIGRKGSVPGQQTLILDALDRRPDVLRPQPQADLSAC